MLQRVGLRCDGGPSIGVGHVVRCLALGDELRARGAEVSLIGDLGGLGWLERQVAARGISVIAAPDEPEALAEVVVGLGLEAVVLDVYQLDPRAGELIRARGVMVLAISDGPFGAGQDADVALDQNLGAAVGVGRHGTFLAGLDYALFRDQILEQRRQPTDGAPRRRSPLRVLAVFGGTDAHAAAPVVVPMLLATGLPVEVVAVAAHPEIAQRLRVLEMGAGQSIEVVPPVDDLAVLAITCDLAVTASGSSVWEFFCLGLPAALVCVTENQVVGYDAVTAAGAAIGIGSLSALRTDPVQRSAGVRALTDLVTNPRLRAALANRGQELIDGRGRQRVVDVLESQQRPGKIDH
ncbi:MAG: hypothetical protein L0H96_06580 [Humibacillus sp.]|nr:hypothetical protein [Humibacillus sp.]MDN5776559.1 hypothetical protein [Humibacillus sp.]